MRHLTGILAATTVLSAFAGMASAEGCGDLTIASMNWQSAEFAAALDQFILNEGFGCNAEIIQGDTVPTITSMVEKGDPQIAPEGWIDLVPEVAQAGLAEGKIVAGATILSDGGVEGWWIPKFIVDAHPEITTIDEVFKHPELFPDPEDEGKGAVHNSPQGWGGTVITTQLYKAYGGEAAGFNLVDTGSAAGLDGSIASAYERQQGWVGYYWSPTALLGKYEMVKLDHGVPLDSAEWKACTSKADCAEPKKNDWPKATVQTLIAKPFAEAAPAGVLDYLNKRSWDNATVNGVMSWMSDNQATGEDGARHFLKENEALWRDWVSPEVAEKIKAAL